MMGSVLRTRSMPPRMPFRLASRPGPKQADPRSASPSARQAFRDTLAIDIGFLTALGRQVEACAEPAHAASAYCPRGPDGRRADRSINWRWRADGLAARWRRLAIGPAATSDGPPTWCGGDAAGEHLVAVAHGRPAGVVR